MPYCAENSSENQSWPHMPKNNQSGPHLKTRQQGSGKWEGRQWVKLSNKICPVSLGLGLMSSCILMLGESWGAFIRAVCEVTFVFFELMGGRLEVMEDGKQRKQDIRLFILGLVYF